MLTALLHTAARRGEVYGLKWKDVNFDAREIALKTRKTKDGSVRKDWIPLTDELFESLWAHRQHSNGSEYVFTQRVGRHNGKRYVENRGFPQELCEKAGVKSFGCHGIRGLTATILVKSGEDMKTVQEILRHRKLATTERYVRKTTGQARRALMTLEGRSKARLRKPVEGVEPPKKPPVAVVQPSEQSKSHIQPPTREGGKGNFCFFSPNEEGENLPGIIH